MADEHVNEDEIIATYFPVALREHIVLTEKIIRRISLDFRTAASAALRLVEEIQGDRPRLPGEDGRFVYRLDTTQRTKQPSSIITKMCRIIKDTKDKNPAWLTYKDNAEAFLDHFLYTELSDVARFRIVCNYISDVRHLGEYLRNSPKLRAQIPLFDPERDYKDRIDDLELRERAQGHRAIHLSLPFKIEERVVRVEVQLMTMLQEAWDKKDHPIYEKRRIGREIPPSAQIKLRAMSDLLYVADEFSDTLWQDITRDEQPVAAGLGE